MNTTPLHIGLILDGNRRWAKAHGRPSIEGHRQGFETLRTILRSAFQQNVSFVSAFVFSTENWQRSRKEISYLMKLAHRGLTREANELHAQGIKIVWFGSSDNMPSKLLNALRDIEEKTKNNTKGTFALCFNYGGQQELVDATKKIVDSGIKAEDISSETISKYIYHPEIPPIDLLIRTSGEQRISGYMLWRVAYSELHFSDKLWPDFTPEDLSLAIEEYSSRCRRFGK